MTMYLKNINFKMTMMLLVFMALSLTGFAQSKKELRADRQMERLAYLTASQTYEEILKEEDSDRVRVKLARCYQKLNNSETTAEWYADITDKEAVMEPIDKLYFAQALNGVGKYPEARKWYEAYYKSINANADPNDLSWMDDIMRFYNDSSLFTITKLEINSDESDFSPSYYDDGLIFASARGKSLLKHNWNKTAYLDLYYTQMNEDGTYSVPDKFNKKVNTMLHEGPVFFYDNGNKMVFTRNNIWAGDKATSSDGVNKLKIFFTEKDDKGNWLDPVSFQYNDDEFSTGHPAISQDGTKMVFASDRPGGHGGVDLYLAKNSNGQWSEPVNLGSDINTDSNDMFPYVDDEGTLYFASNGHAGLGGLDIFSATLDESAPGVINLGYPINSERDDFSLIIDNRTKSGYFSSNRGGSPEDDNIYHFQINEPQFVAITGKVIDQVTKKAIPQAKVSLPGTDIPEFNTDDNGSFEIQLPVKITTLDLEASKPEYKNAAVSLPVAGIEGEVIVELEKDGIALNLCPKDLESKESISDVVLKVKKSGESKDMYSSQDKDCYNVTLEDGVTYDISASKGGYFSTTEQLVASKDLNNSNHDVLMEKIVLNKAIEIENIYYDVNKWNIRPDAAVELYKVVELLKVNPTITIELSSHTDARGSDAYNLSLSDKRAKSAVDYIVSEGIERERIVGKGYGETVLKNRCANGVKCSKEEHQENRRTEFKVTSF